MMSDTADFIIENGLLRHYLGPGGDVAVPEGVTALGEDVFRGCASLTSLTLPSTLRHIAKGALWECTRLERLSMPPSVETIGDWAFFGCSALTWIDFSPCLRSVGDGAFQGCRRLERVVLPAALRHTGHSVFDGCAALESMIFPESLETVGAGMFRACAALTEVRLPNVRAIGARAFWGCSALSLLELPEALETIGDDAFYYCTALRRLALPESLRTIGRCAFYGCSALDDIIFPGIAPEIGRSAFAKTAWWLTQEDGCVWAGDTLYQFKGDMPADTVLSLRPGTRRIAEFAFCGSARLRSLRLPEGVESIGESALEDCRALVEVVLPESLLVIGKSAFKYDRALASLRLPDGVQVIEDGAFAECTGFRQFTLPRALKAIGQGVFAGCGTLERLLVPESASFFKAVEGVLFTKNGKELLLYPEGRADRTYVVPEGVERIDPGAFIGVEKLRELYLPATLETLEPYLFRRTPLRYIRLSRGIRRLGASTFADSTYVAFYYPEMADKVARPVYLGGPIDQLPANCRNAALQGFLYASGIGETAAERWRSSYVAYIRRNESAYARMAAVNEPLLQLMLEEGILSAMSVEALLGGLIGAERTDLTAALLAYQQRNFPDRARSAFTLDEDPDNDQRAAETARRRDSIRQRVGIEGLHIAAAGKLRKFGYYSPSGVVDFSDLAAYIRKRGGVYQSAPAADTDCLICNDPTLAPDKVSQAAELGVPVITEAEFLRLTSTTPRRNYYSV